MPSATIQLIVRFRMWATTACLTRPATAGDSRVDTVYREIGAPLEEVAPEFAHTGDLTLYRLPDSGHHHVASPNRVRLFERLLAWSAAVVPPAGPRTTT